MAILRARAFADTPCCGRAYFAPWLPLGGAVAPLAPCPPATHRARLWCPAVAATEWVQSNFPGQFVVNRFEYERRDTAADRDTEVSLSFSDGSTQSFTLPNDNTLQSFEVAAVRTTSVRLLVNSRTTHNGATTIRFHQACSPGTLTFCGASHLDAGVLRPPDARADLWPQKHPFFRLLCSSRVAPSLCASLFSRILRRAFLVPAH